MRDDEAPVGPSTFAAGTRITDALELTRELAAGGMGAVWEAFDHHRDDRVAVKFLLKVHDPVQRGRLEREARLAADVVHPHAVEVYGHGHTDDGIPFIVMEYIDGESLQQRLMREGPMPTATAGSVVRQLALALEVAHERGIVHRDIKPDNVVCVSASDPLAVKLVDFGIAKPVEQTCTLTRTGQMVGTPVYMAPEQLLEERDIDAGADLWGLALVAYETLAGKRAFAGDNLASTVMRIMLRQYEPLTSLNPELPAALDGFMERALHADQGHRFTTARELAEAFAAAAQGAGPERTPEAKGLRFPERLYGRAQELLALQQAFDAAAKGPSRVAVIAGYAGTGKTSLVRELQRRTAGVGAVLAAGKFDAYDRGTPYASLLDALRQAVRSALLRGPSSVAALRARLYETLGDSGGVLVELARDLEEVIGPQPEVESLSPLDQRVRLKLAIGRLVRAIATAEHPLFLFLDDLQWADLASLDLITSIATEPNSRHVFLVAAYRDHEVDGHHPLVQSLERIREAGRLDELHIGALDEDSVFQLVGDTFPRLSGRMRVASACHAKTRGNAYFLRRFLESIVDGGMVRHDPLLDQWTGDSTAIEALQMPDEVADFIATELDRFPAPTSDALAVAACIAQEFELTLLVQALGIAAREVLQLVRAPLTSELLQPSGTATGEVLVLKFAHDRVRQAARMRLSDARAKEVHRTLGLYLLEHLDAAELGQRLFEVVEHLNRGLGTDAEGATRGRVRALNLRAAQQAVHSAAFQAGDQHFRMAYSLLAEDSWATSYPQTQAIVVQGARAAWLAGDHEHMNRLVDEAIRHSTHVLDRVAAHEVRLQAKQSVGDQRESLDIALAALASLGLPIDGSPSEADVGAVLGETMGALQAAGPEGIARLPRCTDRTVQGRLRILTRSMSTAYQVAPSLLPILTCRIVQETLQSGVCSESPYGLACLGLVLNAVNMHDAAYPTGKLAQDMLDRLGERSVRPRTLHVLGAHVLSFVEPLIECVEIERNVARIGLDTGDLEYAAWGLHCQVCNSFYAGVPLDELLQTFQRNEATLLHHQQLTGLDVTQQYGAAIRVLMGSPPDRPSLHDDDYDEAGQLATFRDTNFRGAAYIISALGGWIRYVFGDVGGAIAMCDEGAEYADGAVATYHQVWWHQTQALALLARGTASDIEAAQPHLVQLQHWATHGPRNHRHRPALVEGELARLRGEHEAAHAAFDDAIEAAIAEGFTHEAAMGLELKATLTARQGHDAASQLAAAADAWQRWGAHAKAEHLRANGVR